jgi:probable phosphoglycerate mutase
VIEDDTMNDLLDYPKPFICLIRHGETAVAKAGLMNGLREEPLTEMGERQAASLQAPLCAIVWDRVLCSPLGRVRRTAELAGFGTPEIVPDLVEFDCGSYEGLTAAEIRSKRPGWDFWRDGCEGGETSETAGARVDRVLARLTGAPGATLVFSHAATSRLLVARFLGLPGHMASGFSFDPAHLSVLGQRSNPAIFLWNDGSHLPAAHKSEKNPSALPH